jgi:uncharacterized protein (DUF2062 family)
MRKWFKRMSPDREKLLANRWMRPFAHRLANPAIWHFNRHSVARGVALGLFVSFLLPIGQIIVAALFAGLARGNVLVAAAATFVANPITFPAIYYGAYRLGHYLLGMATTGTTFAQVEAAPSMMAMFAGATGPTIIGLLIFAVVSSAIGYALVEGMWRVALIRQWRARPQNFAARADKQG